MNALLPEGALDGFSRFTVFTDGLDETLAYVSPLDDTGTRWELAVDPADAGELDWQRLWKRFFKALTIEERRNEKAQMNHVQKRFWKDMVEMQGDLPSPLE